MTIKDPIKMPEPVYQNGRVAVGKDLVFGWVVLTVPQGEEQSRWTPIDDLHPFERRRVKDLLDNDQIFPAELHEHMAKWSTQEALLKPGQLRTPREEAPVDFEAAMQKTQH